MTARFSVLVDDPVAEATIVNTVTATSILHPVGTQATVIDDVNDAPVFDQDLGDRADAEGDTILVSAAASDPEGGLTYAATGLPTGLSIDPVIGEISGTIGYDASPSSPFAVTITVTDHGGLTDVDTFTWTISNTNRAPVVSDPGAQSDAEGAFVSLTVSAVYTGQGTQGFRDWCSAQHAAMRMSFGVLSRARFLSSSMTAAIVLPVSNTSSTISSRSS